MHIVQGMAEIIWGEIRLSRFQMRKVNGKTGAGTDALCCGDLLLERADHALTGRQSDLLPFL